MIKKNLILCVGAPKCGTTFLYKQFVDQQKDLLNEPYDKEISFWGHKTHKPNYTKKTKINMRSLSRLLKRYIYSDYFSNFTTNDPDNFYIDFSPIYMSIKSRDLLEIRGVFNNVKVILCVRNPIDRIQSHLNYSHRLFINRMINKFPIIVTLLPKSRKATSYHKTYNRLAKIFGRDNILVISHERMFSNPTLIESKLHQFTGLHIRLDTSKKINSTKHNIKLSKMHRSLIKVIHKSDIEFWEKVFDRQ